MDNSVIEVQSRATAVAQLLGEEIRSSGWPAGHMLGTKSELQAKYGIARATLNEAVKLLHDRGLATTKPGPKGGVFVVEPNASVQLGRFFVTMDRDLSQVSEAIEMRDHLEILLARHAAVHRSEEDLEMLDKILNGIHSKETAKEQLEEVWALHLYIAQISPNRMVVAIYQALVELLKSTVDMGEKSEEYTEQFSRQRYEAHAALVEAIGTGDPEVAERAAQAHNAS